MNKTLIVMAVVLAALVAAPAMASASATSADTSAAAQSMDCVGIPCGIINYIFCYGHPLHIFCVA